MPQPPTSSVGVVGGTAILVRIPLQIHRGTFLPRCTVAIVPWTRTTRLHVLSLYGHNRSSPDYQTGDTRRLAEVQTYLAGLGSVPWLIGGDWNIEPPDIRSFWHRPHLVVAPAVTTQKFGRILDWFVTGRTIPSVFHNTQVIPGTDHVAVGLRLRGALRSTLGFRARQPHGIEAKELALLQDPAQRCHREAYFGTPPSEWDHWARQAEALLLSAVGVDPKGNQGRGTALKLSRQRISRPQAGGQAIGLNIHVSRLRLRVAQRDRLLVLVQRHSNVPEVVHLRRKLRTSGYPTQEDRALLDRWLQAISKRRQKGLHELGLPAARAQWRQTLQMGAKAKS